MSSLLTRHATIEHKHKKQSKFYDKMARSSELSAQPKNKGGGKKKVTKNCRPELVRQAVFLHKPTGKNEWDG